MKNYYKIALIYTIVCTIYILFSDFIVDKMFSSPALITSIQSKKGIVFVLASGLLILFLVRHFSKSCDEINKNLEDTIRYHKLIFDQHPLPGFIVDANSSKFIAVNKAACSIFGMSEQEFKELKLSDFIIGSSNKEFLSTLSRIKQNGYYEFMIKSHDKNNKIVHQQIFSQPLLYNFKESILMVSQDISSLKESNESLMDKVIEAQEEERRKISGELHDNIKQCFGMITSLIDLVEITEKNIDLLTRIRSFSNEGLEQSRRMSHMLAPGNGEMNLEKSLKHLIVNLNLSSKVSFEIEYDISKNPPSEIGLNLYRIIQEATTNILSHSKSDVGVIRLFEEENNLILEIKDNGIGMDGEILPKSLENLGMNIMRSRATKLKGNFEVYSNKGEGTLLRVTIPLKNG